LLERGKTGPSIGTLVVIAAALGAQMSELVDEGRTAVEELVSRVRDQTVVQTQPGVRRRILRQDRVRAIEIAINEYDPGTSSAPAPQGHEGYEYGIVLDGMLEVAVDGQVHTLRAGDLVSYASPRPHRFANAGNRRARTLWINLRNG
jgi:quercetin dioxygenase-like cupin family protein